MPISIAATTRVSPYRSLAPVTTSHDPFIPHEPHSHYPIQITLHYKNARLQLPQHTPEGHLLSHRQLRVPVGRHQTAPPLSTPTSEQVPASHNPKTQPQRPTAPPPLTKPHPGYLPHPPYTERRSHLIQRLHLPHARLQPRVLQHSNCHPHRAHVSLDRLTYTKSLVIDQEPE